MITDTGERKYLTGREREAFRRALERSGRDAGLFVRMLLETGCRISEALNLTRRQVDLSGKCVVFETLKKRRRGVFRSVPISAEFAQALAAQFKRLGSEERLWTWSRMTGYRHVCAVMKAAGIDGPQASPKGLRHAFAVAALEAGIPLHLVQRWLGHSQLETTTIYVNVVGAEERKLARRLWSRSKRTSPVPSMRGPSPSRMPKPEGDPPNRASWIDWAASHVPTGFSPGLWLVVAAPPT